MKSAQTVWMETILEWIDELLIRAQILDGDGQTRELTLSPHRVETMFPSFSASRIFPLESSLVEQRPKGFQTNFEAVSTERQVLVVTHRQNTLPTL